MNNKEVYFCLKQKVRTKADSIKLDEVCDIYFSDKADEDKVASIKLDVKPGLNKVDAIHIIKLLKQQFNQAKLVNVGDGECYVIKETENKSKLKRIFMLLMIVVVLFFGGAITIMNFHADVNMPKVHENVYRFFGGEGDPPLAVGIFYSFGLLIGFISVLSIFSKSNKYPGLLDLELFNHNAEVLSYKKTAEEREKIE